MWQVTKEVNRITKLGAVNSSTNISENFIRNNLKRRENMDSWLLRKSPIYLHQIFEKSTEKVNGPFRI